MSEPPVTPDIVADDGGVAKMQTAPSGPLALQIGQPCCGPGRGVTSFANLSASVMLLLPMESEKRAPGGPFLE